MRVSLDAYRWSPNRPVSARVALVMLVTTGFSAPRRALTRCLNRAPAQAGILPRAAALEFQVCQIETTGPVAGDTFTFELRYS